MKIKVLLGLAVAVIVSMQAEFAWATEIEGKRGAEFARHLRTFLDEIKYDDAVRAVMGNAYGHLTIFDQAKGKWSVDQSAYDRLTPIQKAAVDYFFLGSTIDSYGYEELSTNENFLAIWAGLDEFNLCPLLMLNYACLISISSYQVADGKFMYIVGDLSSKEIDSLAMRQGYVSPTDGLILNTYIADQEKNMSRGVVLDRKAGVGTLAVGLLMTSPSVTHVYAVVLDYRHAELTRLNANLNEVARHVTIIQADAEGAKEKLAGVEVDINIPRGAPVGTVPRETPIEASMKIK